jgi:hypothetical protein
LLSQYPTGFRYIRDALDFKDMIYYIRANEESTNYAISQLYERTIQATKGHQFKLSVLSLLKLYLGDRYASTDSCITKLMQRVIDENKPADTEDAVFLGKSIWELQSAGIENIKNKGGGLLDLVTRTKLNIESNFYQGLVSKSITTLLPVDKEYVKSQIIPVIKENGFSPAIFGFREADS